MADGSKAYQQLRSTDNPFDPKVATPLAQVTVSAPVCVDDEGGGTATDAKRAATSTDHAGHP